MRSFIALMIAGSVAVAGCAVSPAEGEDSRVSVQSEPLSAFGKTLVGTYRDQAASLQLESTGDYVFDTGIRCITQPCPSGDRGKWAVYVGYTGTRYVELTASSIVRWYRVQKTEPIVLAGAFGTEGKLVKEVAPSGCATARCAAGFYCDDSTRAVRCLPYETCARAPACERGTHCEDLPIDCVRAPCPPTAPSCVAD
jgi:hypothetical protein